MSTSLVKPGDSELLLLPAGTYVENPEHRMPKVFLPEDIYAAAITGFVIVCTDAVIVNRERQTIYLAKRRTKPMQGWWVVGGRRFAGERIHESIVRCFRRETGLLLDAARFSLLDINEYIWQDREQEPQNLGSHNMGHTFTVELTEEELRNIHLEENEFEDGGLQEFVRERLVSENVHPALVDMYDQVFTNV